MKRLAIVVLAAISLPGFSYAHAIDLTSRPGFYAAQPRHEGPIYAPAAPEMMAPNGHGNGCFVQLSPTEVTKGIRHWRPSC